MERITAISQSSKILINQIDMLCKHIANIKIKNYMSKELSSQLAEPTYSAKFPIYHENISTDLSANNNIPDLFEQAGNLSAI